MATTIIMLDLKEVLQFTRIVRTQKPALLKAAANRFARYTRQRFISLSGKGGGEWPKLHPTTVSRKEARGIAQNPSWILRESDTLLKSLGAKPKNDYYIVGIVKPALKPPPTYMKVVKRTRRKVTYKAITTGQLARFHHFGRGNNPRRPIFTKPNTNMRKQMTEDVRKELRKLRGK